MSEVPLYVFPPCIYITYMSEDGGGRDLEVCAAFAAMSTLRPWVSQAETSPSRDEVAVTARSGGIYFGIHHRTSVLQACLGHANPTRPSVPTVGVSLQG